MKESRGKVLRGFKGKWECIGVQGKKREEGKQGLWRVV